jgi:hypothetical protein
MKNFNKRIMKRINFKDKLIQIKNKHLKVKINRIKMTNREICSNK